MLSIAAGLALTADLTRRNLVHSMIGSLVSIVMDAVCGRPHTRRADASELHWPGRYGTDPA